MTNLRYTKLLLNNNKFLTKIKYDDDYDDDDDDDELASVILRTACSV
jgi:hypothetical protein